MESIIKYMQRFTLIYLKDRGQVRAVLADINNSLVLAVQDQIMGLE